MQYRQPSLLVATLLSICLFGCWESDSPYPDIDDSSDSTDDSRDNQIENDVSCYDLSPCVVSDSGYQCPGAVNGVMCWDFGSQCKSNYLCASTRQACLIVCETENCSISGSRPPRAMCN